MALSDSELKQAVEGFLATGTTTEGLTLEELGAACDRRVRAETQVSARDAVELGRAFVRYSAPHGGALRLIALRAHGWAALVAGLYREAEKAYLQARDLAEADRSTRARIDRVLIDVYMYLGNMTEARRRAQLALAAFRRAGAHTDVAKTQVNLANVLHRQDRHREAGHLYRKASAHFAKSGDDLAKALCEYNDANTRVQLFDFKRATSLYTRARSTFEKHGQHLHATGCLYGLAWLHMLEGSFHTALTELSECESEYRRGNHERELVTCLLDRAEVYLGLNLYLDARTTAEEAINRAEHLGIGYEAAKGWFFAGKASLGLGQRRLGRAALGKASKAFQSAGNSAFAASAELTLAQIESSRARRLSRIRELRPKFRKAQLPLWEAICDLEILTEWPENTPAIRRVARNEAVRSVPHLLARQLTLQGDRLARRRSLPAAVRYWTKAAQVLDAVRSALPPVEMRSAFFAPRSAPHQRLVEAECDRNPLKAALWSESLKTAGVLAPLEESFQQHPARDRIRSSLADLAQQVIAASGAISGGEGNRSFASARLTQRFERTQKRVRDELAGFVQGTTRASEGIDRLSRSFREASFGQAILQFHVSRGDIFAFVHSRGTVRSHRFVDGVRVVHDLTGRWRFQVEFAPASGRRTSPRRLADEVSILSKLGSWLLPPLEIPQDEQRLLILPEGEMTSVPWASLRHGRRSLCEQFQIILAPSLRHHLYAEKQTTSAQTVKVFVGSTKGIPLVRSEVDAVTSRFAAQSPNVYDPCRRADWPSDSEDRLWHFAGHADLRADNPFYSSLLLADGPMFAAEFRLRRNRVDLVTLSACRTGQQTSLPGEEASGLVRALLEMGARNILASQWAVSDRPTALWMDHFYSYYLGGAPAARAIQLATQEIKENFPSAYHWGAFALHGAG
jgi:tetratricopeptide (TPR) repeat protein